MKLFYCVLFLLLVAYSSFSDKGTFNYVLTSGVDPLYGVSLESTVPAVNLALDYINNNSSLLPGLNLTYSDVSLVECSNNGSILEEILTDVYNHAILGFSCSEVPYNEPFVGDTLNFTSMIHYTPTPVDVLLNSSSDSDQHILFGLHPSPSTYAQTLTAFLEKFQWQRLLTVTQGENYFSDVLDSIKIRLQDTDITLFELEQNTTGDDLDIPDDIRIIFLNMDFTNAATTLCKGYDAGLLFPRYVWITYAGDFEGFVPSPGCFRNKLADFLDGVFTLLPARGDARNSVMFPDLMNIISDLEEMQGYSPLSYFAIDAVLTLAQAINDTLAGWSNNSPDWSFCEMENELRQSSLSKCFVRQKIKNVLIYGLTGEISFNEQGERVINVIGISQYRRSEVDQTSIPQSQFIASITVNATSDESSFEFVVGENETTIFRGPIPADGTPLKNISLIPLVLIIIYYILASLGISFAIVCLLFNVIFRKRKIVKLISPNLNYFIIAGGIILYSSVYFRLFPDSSEVYVNIRCNAQTLLTCLGYVFCFAPVLMKMFRVYYIFHNPSPNKKALKDWHLFLGTSIIVGIIFVMVCLGYIVPILRSNPSLIPDVERPTGITEDGIRIENCIYQCYGFTVTLVWLGVEYLYMISLQVVALVLAIVTRKVKIKVLNDSREMAIIIYTTTTVMLVLGIITFALGSRLIINEIIFSGGIMIATTVFLTLVFIPKMVDLHHDPRGEGIFGKTDNTLTASTIEGTL